MASADLNPLMTPGARACIVFNPTACGEKALLLRSCFDSLPSHFVLRPTQSAGDAIRLAREAVNDGFRLVVAAGGDGTVNEVLNGMMTAEAAKRASVILGLIPLGTVNVFAKELRVPMNIEAALRLLEGGRVRQCAVPSAEFRNAAGHLDRRYFIQLAGAGLDSRAIQAVRWDLKKRWGSLAYVSAGFHVLGQKAAPIEVLSSERTAQGELVLIGNGRFYGGKIVMFPDAQLEEDWLEVIVFPKARLGTLVGFGMGWLTGSIHRFTGIQRWKTRRVELKCKEAMPLELEGDNVGNLPGVFEQTGATIGVLVPR